MLSRRFLGLKCRSGERARVNKASSRSMKRRVEKVTKTSHLMIDRSTEGRHRSKERERSCNRRSPGNRQITTAIHRFAGRGEHYRWAAADCFTCKPNPPTIPARASSLLLMALVHLVLVLLSTFCLAGIYIFAGFNHDYSHKLPVERAGLLVRCLGAGIF